MRSMVRTGRYVPIKQIWKAEGEDQEAAEATMNYVLTAISKVKAGELLDGNPYIIFNTWTRRYDFLYLEKSIGQSFKRVFEVRQQEAPVQFDGSKADDRDEEPAAKKAKKGEGKKAKGGKGGKDKEGKEVTEAEAKKKAEEAANRRILDQKLAKTKGLKIRMDAAQSSLAELIHLTSNAPEWKWCTEHHLQEPRAAKATLDLFKTKNAFWSAWATRAGFAAFAKKQWKKDELEHFLGQISEVEKMVCVLEKKVNTLMKMHAARPSEADDRND
jgi:hypothetical protein